MRSSLHFKMVPDTEPYPAVELLRVTEPISEAAAVPDINESLPPADPVSVQDLTAKGAKWDAHWVPLGETGHTTARLQINADGEFALAGHTWRLTNEPTKSILTPRRDRVGTLCAVAVDGGGSNNGELRMELVSCEYGLELLRFAVNSRAMGRAVIVTRADAKAKSRKACTTATLIVAALTVLALIAIGCALIWSNSSGATSSCCAPPSCAAPFTQFFADPGSTTEATGALVNADAGAYLCDLRTPTGQFYCGMNNTVLGNCTIGRVRSRTPPRCTIDHLPAGVGCLCLFDSIVYAVFLIGFFLSRGAGPAQKWWVLLPPIIPLIPLVTMAAVRLAYNTSYPSVTTTLTDFTRLKGALCPWNNQQPVLLVTIDRPLLDIQQSLLGAVIGVAVALPVLHVIATQISGWPTLGFHPKYAFHAFPGTCVADADANSA